MTILTSFLRLNITIDERKIHLLEKLVIAFEIRGTHAIALNSQSIGVHPIAFTDSDRSAFFDLWDLHESRMKEIIRETSGINLSWKVTSDAFNLLCIWLLHLAVRDIADLKIRENFQLNIAKYLHYRFFTSLVNHYLPHGANDAVMTAVVNSLTRKFDIVVYGNWRKTIEARCLDLISKDGIHYATIQSFTPDPAVLRILSDTQTRIRDKIGNICDRYYEYHKDGTAIKSKPATDTDLDGEKIVVSKHSVFDSAISNLTIEILNLHQFIDRTAATQVASQFSAVSTSMLIAVLTEWSSLATTQTNERLLDYVETTKDGPLYIGARRLISEIIQTSFRYCINNRISLSSRTEIWVRLKHVYSSSRVNDADILAIKRSVEYFVDALNRSPRESTKASIRIALIMYVIYRSFRYLN